MAKKKKDAGEAAEGETPKKSKKKLIVMVVVIVLIGGFVAKTILLKPPPLTAKQVAQAAKVTELTLENLCASHNGLPSKPLPTDAGSAKKAAPSTTTTTTTIADAPTPAGPVDSLDAITINLAAGHYLKVGLALQVPVGLDPTTVKNTENWEAVALKTVIDTLSGQTIDQLAATRQQQENNIGDTVCRKTDGKVLTIYFTDFVMQ